MQQKKDYFTSKSAFKGLAIILLLMLLAAYSNHFTNDFQFDDTHSIVHNEYIRNIKNLSLFFTDIKYFGTNVNNQTYRPIVVSLNAIDYWLAGSLNPVVFHVDIFVSYLALLVLLFFFYKSIFQTSGEAVATNRGNSLVALMAVGFYGLHAANAETINYIIQRADSLSTLFIIASLLLYINPKSRKYYLYLITIVLAIVTKEIAVITGGLLFFYILLFDNSPVSKEDRIITFVLLSIYALLLEYFHHFSLNIKDGTIIVALFGFYILLFKLYYNSRLSKYIKLKNSIRAFMKSFPALFFTYLFFGQIEYWFMTGHSETTNEAFPPALNYYATEAEVFVHYLANFVLPVDLSTSSSFTLLSSVINPKVLVSFFLILVLILIAFITSREKDKRPIAFGIAWFFVTLVPSSFVPKFGEFSNDHRTFLPYIGLVMSLVWWLRLIYLRYQTKIKKSVAGIKQNVSSLSKSKSVKGSPTFTNKNINVTKIIAVCYFIIISLHGYGTFQRNIVWSSQDNLWHDAFLKNPDEPMALMNYGLTLMNKGEYKETLKCFERVLKIYPDWAYINVNMGVLKDNMGKPLEAEGYFQKAIQLQPYYPVGYYHYARFLLRYGKKEKAIAKMEAGLKVSPGDAQIIELLNQTRSETPETKREELNKMAAIASQNPTAFNYLNLSVSYYQNGMYKECIEACEKALKLDPVSAMAYNNICSCYNALGQWAKAEEACKKSLQIDSTLLLAKNNLITAQKNLK